MNTQHEILDFLKDHKAYLESEYHVSKIGLFGSFARHEQSEKSDVDIIFDFKPDTPHIYDIKEALKVYLSAALGRSVDLAREKYLKPYAKSEILKNVIYV
ncbi:MAG: hypothetical protein B5M52_05830 [Helicobacteraceae bacterium 4484_230]|nr:MAG: hypothetical protein B5M52_05830 [Helicobacteraceae bacterium 4484_230]